MNTQFETISPTTMEASNAAKDWKIAPYGEHPVMIGGTRVMQVFDEQAADVIIAEYERQQGSILRRLGKAIGIGAANIPVYHGHPDAVEFRGQDIGEDTRTYAHIARLEKRADGLYAPISDIEKSNAFDALLAQRPTLQISPRWGMQWLDDAKTRARPVTLISVGLWPTGNLADAGVANAKHSQKMKEKLKHILALFGFATDRIEATLAEGANAISLTEIDAAHSSTAKVAAANAVSSEIATLLKALGMTDEEAAALPMEPAAIADAIKAKITEAASAHVAAAKDTELAAANAAVKEHRTAHAAMLVEAAISDGRITLAQRDAEIAKLTTAPVFAEAANALQALTPSVKTTSCTSGIGKRKNEMTDAANASATLMAKAKELQDNQKLSFERAYELAKTQNPTLTAQL